MADGYVQVASDAGGKKIDNAELTREQSPLGTAAVVVERQRVVLASDENPRQQVDVDGEAGQGTLAVGGKMAHSLGEIERSLKMLVVMVAFALEINLDNVEEIVDLNN
jgi:hypothetical protein